MYFKAIVSVFLFGILLPFPVSAKMEVMALRSSQWIYPDQIPKGDGAVTLQACRNGHDGFQLAVVANGSCLQDVKVSITEPLQSASGEILSTKSISVFQEVPLPVTTPSGMEADLYPEGEVFDPLLPLSRTPFEEGSNRTEAVQLGRIGAVGKSYLARGDGGCFAEGCYRGVKNRYYIVEIEASGEIGSATFRWTDEWDGDFANRQYQYYTTEVPVRSWKGSGLPVSKNAVALDNGVSLRFTPGGAIFNGQHKHYKNVSVASFVRGDRFYFKATTSRTAALYFDVYIPPDQSPGRYIGSVQVDAAGEKPVTLPVTLTVYDIILPQQKSMASAYGRQPKASHFHRSDRPDFSLIQKRYEEMLHQHRLDYEIFDALPVFTFNSNGELVNTDWSRFDALAAPRLNGSYWQDGIGMRGFTLDFNWVYPGSPYLQRTTEEKKAIAKETARHLRKKGWFDKVYVYCLDEPQPLYFPAIVEDIQTMLAADSGWKGKFMVTSNPFHGSLLENLVDIWVPSTLYYDNWSEYGRRNRENYTRADYAQLAERGDTFWLYVANYPLSEPYLSYQLDRKNMYEPRLLKWASWYEGATGFLYYSTMMPGHAVPNPYLNPLYTERYDRNGKGSGVNGDGQLIYPGDLDGSDSWTRSTGSGVPFKPVDGPLASLRLKQIRDGFEDWEMFLIGDSLGLTEQIRELVEQVYSRLGSDLGSFQPGGELPWDRSGEKMWQVRDEIARMIEQAGQHISQ